LQKLTTSTHVIALQYKILVMLQIITLSIRFNWTHFSNTP